MPPKPASRVLLRNKSVTSMFILLALTSVLMTSSVRPHPSYGDVVTLHSDLFDNYSRNVRPVWNQSDAVPVLVDFELLSIVHLDPVRQELTLSCVVCTRWTDLMLNWDPQQYGGLSSLHPSLADMWAPPLVVMEMKEEAAETMLWHTDVILQHNGSAFVRAKGHVIVACDLDMTFFPFDKQTCTVSFMASDYTEAEVVLVGDRQFSVTRSVRPNRQWEVYSRGFLSDVYGSEPQTFSRIRFELSLHRLYTYYLLNMLLPYVLLSMLTLLAFLVPLSSGERAAFGLTGLLAQITDYKSLSRSSRCSHSSCRSAGLTGLLAQVVFLNVLSDAMPRSSDDAPLVMLLCLTLLALSAAAVVMSVVSLRTYHLHHSPGGSSFMSRLRDPVKLVKLYLGRKDRVARAEAEQTDPRTELPANRDPKHFLAWEREMGENWDSRGEQLLAHSPRPGLGHEDGVTREAAETHEIRRRQLMNQSQVKNVTHLQGREEDVMKEEAEMEEIRRQQLSTQGRPISTPLSTVCQLLGDLQCGHTATRLATQHGGLERNASGQAREDDKEPHHQEQAKDDHVKTLMHILTALTRATEVKQDRPHLLTGVSRGSRGSRGLVVARETDMTRLAKRIDCISLTVFCLLFVAAVIAFFVSISLFA